MKVFPGTDLLEIQRLADILACDSGAFLSRVYSEAEQRQARERPEPLHYYATRFAGKEAVIKALHLCQVPIHFGEIQILADADGCPQVTLLGQTSLAARSAGLTSLKVSLSFDGGYALAYALAVQA